MRCQPHFDMLTIVLLSADVASVHISALFSEKLRRWSYRKRWGLYRSLVRNLSRSREPQKAASMTCPASWRGFSKLAFCAIPSNQGPTRVWLTAPRRRSTQTSLIVRLSGEALFCSKESHGTRERRRALRRPCRSGKGKRGRESCQPRVG